MRFMQHLSFLSALIVSLSLFGSVKANIHGTPRRRHAVNALPRAESHLGKRFDNARYTHYAVGLGACGKYNSDSEFVIALNVPQYADGAHCFDTVTLTYEGKSAQAQVVDECMGCPFGAIDLSPALMDFLAPGQDEVSGSWVFGSGDPPPKPTPSSTPPPPPPSTSHTSTPSSTPSPTPTPSSTKPSTTLHSSTPTSTSHSSTFRSSSSVTPSSTPVSSSATPSATAAATPAATPESGTLNGLSQAFLGIAALAVEAQLAQ